MRLEGDAWQTYFDAFDRDAFRLETLPVYTVEGEREDFRRFLEEGPESIQSDTTWTRRIRQYRDSGRWIGRVHVVRRPLSDYLRFEFAYYHHSIRAGEDVRILDLTNKPNPGLPEQDFWLFDESRVVRMDYAPDGTQTGRELLEGVDPAPYVEWKRIALEHAEPFDKYWMSHAD
jgi:hypothetical protein